MTVFPSAWRLSRREAMMLERLGISDRVISESEFDELIKPLRGNRIDAHGKIIKATVGRTVRGHIFYLRKKLEPHDIRIEHHGRGYFLPPTSRETVANYIVTFSKSSAA